jgi:hypothetical protein
VITTKTLLDPLVTVETKLDRIRDVGANLEERRAPGVVVDVEVELIDGDRLAREVEGDGLTRPAAFVGFEGPHLFLRHAEDHDPLLGREAGAIAGHDGVLVLPRFELDLRNAVARDELVDGVDKAIVERPE